MRHWAGFSAGVFFGGELEGKIGRVDLAINFHADVPLIHESSLLAAAFEGPVERPILGINLKVAKRKLIFQSGYCI
jgi:hypothetical protein